METELRPYLYTLTRQLKLDPRQEQEILLELQGHLEDRVNDLQAEGLSREEAITRAVEYMGRPEQVARGMYQVHSRGSWRDTLLATLPHLLLAALFALHLWTKFLLLIIVLVAVTLVVIASWRRGKPKWSYSWLGYSIAAPALSWLLATMALVYSAWKFLTTGDLPFYLPMYILIVAYIPFSLWIMANVMLPVVRRDWLMASLAALPFPFLTTWILFLNWQGGIWADDKTKVHETDGDRALVFLALALTTAVFLKVGHRLVQIGMLTASTAFLVAFTVVAIPISFGLLAAILIIFASMAFLLSPAVLVSKLERGQASDLPLDPGAEVAAHWSPNAR